MGNRAFLGAVEAQLKSLFTGSGAEPPPREDSRAFGAMIEERLLHKWRNVCRATSAQYVDRHGRRTIYDFAAKHNGLLYGFDAKTKNLDPGR